MEWISSLSPAVVLGLVFYFTIASLRSRIKTLEDKYLAKELFNVIQRELKESIDELKDQNGKLDSKVDQQAQKITEMGSDIKWIRRTIEKNNN